METKIARERLETLIRRCSKDLISLGESPVAIGQSTSCFDDKSSMTPWQAVQVGSLFWEWRDYFGDDMYVGAYPDDKLVTGNAEPDDEKISRARGVLKELAEANWIDLVDQAFSGGKGTWDETVALVYQLGSVWLVVSSSNECGTCKEMAYLLTEKCGLLEISKPVRFDQTLGAQSQLPLQLERWNPATEALLEQHMPAYCKHRASLFSS